MVYTKCSLSIYVCGPRTVTELFNYPNENHESFFNFQKLLQEYYKPARNWILLFENIIIFIFYENCMSLTCYMNPVELNQFGFHIPKRAPLLNNV